MKEKVKAFIAHLKTITLGTWVRSAAAIAVVVVLVAPIFGFDTGEWTEERIELTAERLLSALAVLAAAWKNNSFTKKAIQADLVLRSKADICPLKEEEN